jgi:hypothetical protein
MSAIGTKQTRASALQMSAFGGKADIGPDWRPSSVVGHFLLAARSQGVRL